MTDTRPTCPVCGWRAKRLWGRDWEDLAHDIKGGWIRSPGIDTKSYDLDSDLQQLFDALLRRGLVEHNSDTDGIPFVRVCDSCDNGIGRCTGCGRVSRWGEECGPCFRKRLGIESRTADSQRQKVYDVERRIFREAFAQNIAVEEAEQTLKKLSRRFHTKVPALTRLPRSAYTRGGDYGYRGIRVQMPHNAAAGQPVVCLGTLVHEFAHHLNQTNYGRDVAGHGPEFVRAFREVMHYMGFRAVITRKEHKIRIGSEREFYQKVRSPR